MNLELVLSRNYSATKRPLTLCNDVKFFYSSCLVKNGLCDLIIVNGSYKNIMSRALVDHLKLETESHPHPYAIGWIKKGPSIKVTYLCHDPISFDKYYQYTVTCDVVDMDAYHILLRRP